MDNAYWVHEAILRKETGDEMFKDLSLSDIYCGGDPLGLSELLETRKKEKHEEDEETEQDEQDLFAMDIDSDHMDEQIVSDDETSNNCNDSRQMTNDFMLIDEDAEDTTDNSVKNSQNKQRKHARKRKFNQVFAGEEQHVSKRRKL